MKNRNVIRILSEAISVITSEITWCNNDFISGKVTSEQHEWFIKGLRQSIYLIERMITTLNAEDKTDYGISPLNEDFINTAKRLQLIDEFIKRTTNGR